MVKDLEDFKELYQTHEGFLRAVLYRLVGPQMVDDVVQETFFKAWKSRESFKGESSLKTWLHKIATNSAIDALRSKKEMLSLEEVNIPATEHGMDLQRDIDQVVLMLPMEFRVVVVSIIFQEMTIKETCEALNLPEGTVKSRLFRGRELLQSHLKERGYDHGK